MSTDMYLHLEEQMSLQKRLARDLSVSKAEKYADALVNAPKSPVKNKQKHTWFDMSDAAANEVIATVIKMMVQATTIFEIPAVKTSTIPTTQKRMDMMIFIEQDIITK
jgi:hypothetical protein